MNGSGGEPVGVVGSGAGRRLVAGAGASVVQEPIDNLQNSSERTAVDNLQNKDGRAKSTIILGLDVAFATCGWATARISPAGPDLLAVGIIRTKPGEAALHKSEDNFQRMRETYRALEAVREKWQPSALALESQSWPRNAGAVAKIAMAWGVVASIAALWDLPTLHNSPQRIHKLTTGNIVATKEAVRKGLACCRGFEKLEDLLAAAGLPPSYWEHPSDAAAAIYAALDTEPGRLLRSMAA